MPYTEFRSRYPNVVLCIKEPGPSQQARGLEANQTYGSSIYPHYTGSNTLLMRSKSSTGDGHTPIPDHNLQVPKQQLYYYIQTKGLNTCCANEQCPSTAVQQV
jgi:hypothetical protein